jgi:hypothetical protein
MDKVSQSELAANKCDKGHGANLPPAWVNGRPEATEQVGACDGSGLVRLMTSADVICKRRALRPQTQNCLVLVGLYAWAVRNELGVDNNPRFKKMAVALEIE